MPHSNGAGGFKGAYLWAFLISVVACRDSIGIVINFINTIIQKWRTKTKGKLMGHSCVSIFYHFVWSTKNRLPLLTGDIKKRVHCYIRSMIERQGKFEVVAIGGIYDHVHLLVKVERECFVSNFVRNVKQNSSKFVDKIDDRIDYFIWQTGYSAFSVSPKDVPRIKKYILNQEEHHKTYKFEDELKLF